MEIEVKFKCRDFEKVESKLIELGAVLAGEKRQIDIYFDHPGRVLVETNEYLRIRTQGDRSELDYHRALSETTGFNEEHETEIGDREELIVTLKSLGFKQLGTIDKSRKKYEFDGCEICLDRVEGIGDFVEIEVKGENEKEGKDKCLRMAESLGLKLEDKTDLVLCDIAVGKVKL